MDNRTRNLMMGAAGVESKTYIEDVFSTYLYTGNGSSQTITNGIDLAGKGGLVWTKARGSAYNHELSCTDLATSYFGTQGGLRTNQDVKLVASDVTGYTSTGFTLGYLTGFGNFSGEKYVSWTFRKAAKFFDVVTWTGDGSASRQISHALGSTPGCAFIKRTDSTSNWVVHHRGFTSGAYVAALNLTDGQGIQTGDNWSPSTTTFNVYNSVLTNWATNINNATYVAYLFAHDTTADGMIQCGSFTTDGSGNATVSLGWESQWILVKRSDSTGVWFLLDTLRGWVNPAKNSYLQAQDSAAETTGWASGGYPTSTGFYANLVAGATYIYIAIRRGPMKTPTSGASVFSTATGTYTSLGTLTAADMVLFKGRNSYGQTEGQITDRLRGFLPFSSWTVGTTSSSPFLVPSSTSAESTSGSYTGSEPTGLNVFGNKNAPLSVVYGNPVDSNASGSNYSFRRAPGFFDVVAYTGTGASTVCSHSLAATPELIIIKRRNAASTNWVVTSAYSGDLILNQNSGANGSPWSYNITAPTNTQFWPRNGISNGDVNESGGTYVAYLFASCPGVSKVGSYTGTGTTLQIDCGFTNGARFVLIKRTDSTGDWYVWDTARGIVAANDPYILLNSTAAEVTNTDYIDPYAAGFEISSTSPAAINALNGSYIYLAIA